MSNHIYTALEELRANNPELTFNNDGYQNLNPDVVERNKEAIAEIESLLKTVIFRFVRFQNFKPRKDGTIAVRYQVHYDASFVGVGYKSMDELKETTE